MPTLTERERIVLIELKPIESISVEQVSSGGPWPAGTLRALQRKGLVQFAACCAKCDHVECQRWYITDDGRDAVREIKRRGGNP